MVMTEEKEYTFATPDINLAIYLSIKLNRRYTVLPYENGNKFLRVGFKGEIPHDLIFDYNTGEDPLVGQIIKIVNLYRHIRQDINSEKIGNG